MFKKYHVGEFIKDYMESLDLNDSTLSRLSGISRDHIINLKACRIDLSSQIAVSLAPFLNVRPEFLMSLQISYNRYKDAQEAKVIDEKVYNLTSFGFKRLIDESYLSRKTFDLFSKDQNKYCEDLSIVHYQPNKANPFKNYLYIEALNGFENNENKLNIPSLSSFVEGDFFDKLASVDGPEKAFEFIDFTRKSLFKLGVNVKVVRTGLKTTIKGISKYSNNNVNIIIENNGRFSDIVWYLTHEIAHIFLKEEEITGSDLEFEANEVAKKILLKDYSSYLTSLNFEDLSRVKEVNKYVLQSCWNFSNGHHVKNNDDDIKMEDVDDFYTQLQ